MLRLSSTVGSLGCVSVRCGLGGCVGEREGWDGMFATFVLEAR